MTVEPAHTAPDIHALLEQCQSGDPDAQLDAIRALREAGATEAAPALVPLLSSEDEFVKEAAIRALGDIGHEHLDQVGPALEGLLVAPQELMRQAAIESLSDLHYLPSRPALERVLRQDEDWAVRASAAEALGGLGDAQALEALEAALDDAVDPVRAYVATAIGQLGGAMQLPTIKRRLAGERHPQPRAAMTAAALRLADESAFDDLLALVQEVDEGFAAHVFGAIDALLSDRTPPVMVKRAVELEERVAELVHRLGGDDAYTAKLRSRLLELTRSTTVNENEGTMTAPVKTREVFE